jgi:hypothetical protein
MINQLPVEGMLKIKAASQPTPLNPSPLGAYNQQSPRRVIKRRLQRLTMSTLPKKKKRTQGRAGKSAVTQQNATHLRSGTYLGDSSRSRFPTRSLQKIASMLRRREEVRRGAKREQRERKRKSSNPH